MSESAASMQAIKALQAEVASARHRVLREVSNQEQPLRHHSSSGSLPRSPHTRNMKVSLFSVC